MANENVPLSNTPPPLPSRNALWVLLLGIVVSNAIGGTVLFAVTLFVGAFRDRDVSALVAWHSFFLITLLVGLVAAWFWRRINRTSGWSFLDGLWVSLMVLAAAAFILHEGVVCLL